MTVKRWMLDCEFNVEQPNFELISIALVSDDGREYYAVNQEFNQAKCGKWLQENVLPKLPPFDMHQAFCGNYKTATERKWKPRSEIAYDIRQLLTTQLSGDKSQVWAYFASYDWVMLCELLGGMHMLPSSCYPTCIDLKQEMIRLGIYTSNLPPKPKDEHDALIDARYQMECLKIIESKYGRLIP